MSDSLGNWIDIGNVSHVSRILYTSTVFTQLKRHFRVSNTGCYLDFSSVIFYSCPQNYYWNNSDCVACPAGLYAVGSPTVCNSCDAGTVSNSAGNNCTACAAGKYTLSRGYIKCAECAAGNFTSSTASSSCDRCPPGSFSSSSMATACTCKLILSFCRLAAVCISIHDAYVL